MMAIENTIAGSLLQNHELIREGNCRIVGEYKLRIMHSFAALPGTHQRKAYRCQGSGLITSCEPHNSTP